MEDSMNGTNIYPLPAADPQRLLPQDLEAERGVICAMLKDPDGVIPRVRKLLDTEDFHHPAHAIMFKAIMELYYETSSCDLIVLTKWLRDGGDLERVGGSFYVTETAGFLPTASCVEQHAEIVREQYRLRKAIEAGANAVNRSYERGAQPEEVLNNLRESIAALEKRSKPSTLPLLGLDEIISHIPDPKDDIWPGSKLTAGMPAGIIGAPGAGKSRISLQAAVCTLLGKPFLGWETRGEGLKWLFLQTENSIGRLQSDLMRMTRTMTPEEKDKIRQGLRILDVMAMDFATICMTVGHPNRDSILNTIEAWRPDVVVVDPLRDAGVGDPNKDQDMTETCQGISATIRRSNPRRVPFVVHHGRTGAQEASRVFGDDSASFGRNSKVLNGWLRSQINVAPAGIEWPDTVIVGCGKCSNSQKWEPFAARLDSQTMTYQRLEKREFDLDEWAEKMGSPNHRNKKKAPTSDQVAEIVTSKGGKVKGGVRAAGGLVWLVQQQTKCTRADAQLAVELAVQDEVITSINEPRAAHGGGSPVRYFTLHPGRKLEPKASTQSPTE